MAVTTNEKKEKLYKYLSEDEILSKLEILRNQADKGMIKDADCMIAEMRTKYGLVF